MASRQSGLTGLYPQRKKSSTSGKASRSSEQKDDLLSAYRGSGNSATVSIGSGVAQPDALLSSRGGQKDLSGDHDNMEETLCQFDMNSAYGPCIGMTRMERWERAKKLGLNPPESIRELLENLGASPDCLWEGRV